MVHANRLPAGILRLLLCLAILHGASFAVLASETENPDQEMTQDRGLADYGEVGASLQFEGDAEKLGHISLGPLDGPFEDYFALKQALKTRWGLNYTIELAPQFQWDWRGTSGTTANNETNLIVQWSPLDPGKERTGNLLLWYQFSDTWSDQTTTDYMSELGVISPLNGGDTHPARHRDLLQHLSWESWFFNESLRVQFGKLTTRTFLNLNRYAVGDREDFFSPMLVNNTVAPYTARVALGAFGKYQARGWSLLFMARDADGTSATLETSLSGKWEYAVEFTAEPEDLFGLGRGNYRFTYYHTDAIGDPLNGQPAGWNASISFDQDLGRRFGAVVRYSYSSEPFRTFRERAALAVQIKQPLGFANDRIGFGLWWGRPVEGGPDNETGLEAFWKFQLTRFTELTANIQIIPEPALAEDGKAALSGGLRLRLLL